MVRGKGRLALAAISIALLAGAAAPGGASGAIKVLSKDQTTLTSFRSVKCKLSTVKGDKTFRAGAKQGSWRLHVVIFPGSFDGFRTYEVMYGGESPVDVNVGPQGRIFSNIFEPEIGIPGGPDLTVAGGVGFPGKRGKRRVLGVGVPLIYDSSVSGDWVSVAGRAPCKR